METQYLYPTQEAGRDFVKKKIAGPIVMLNLLRFRDMADYTETPDLTPDYPISGQEAFNLYIKATLPFLTESGGEVLFYGKCSHFLVGPAEESWDAMLLIRQKSVDSFLAFQENKEYMKILGHRTAALSDSRLLPIEEEAYDF